MKFSITRSAISTLRAVAFDAASFAPFSKRAPSSTSVVHFASASISRNARRAAS
jgi:hypothetical protein